ncbi:hypothetical protein [Cupriavidus basilensis]
MLRWREEATGTISVMNGFFASGAYLIDTANYLARNTATGNRSIHLNPVVCQRYLSMKWILSLPECRESSMM